MLWKAVLQIREKAWHVLEQRTFIKFQALWTSGFPTRSQLDQKPVTQIKFHFWTMPCGLCKEHLLVLLPAFEIVQLECFELMHLATDPAVASLFDSFMPPQERCFLKENLCIVLLLDLPCSSSPPSPPSSTPTHSSHVPAASPRGFLPHLTTAQLVPEHN